MRNEVPVLVGSAISTRHIYCLEDYLEALANLDYGNYKVLLVDTSSDTKTLRDWIPKHYPEFQVIGWHGLHKHRFELMASVKELFRQVVLDCGFSYWFCVDADTIIPKDSLKRLVSHDKPVCGMLQKHGWLDKTWPCVMKEGRLTLGVDSFFERWDFYTWDEIEQLKKRGVTLLRCFYCGISPTLISREVLKRVSFKYDGVMLGEDIRFFLDLKQEGIPCYCDLTLWADHRNTGWDGYL